MSQSNSNEKLEAMIAKIEEINRIEGFEPSLFAVDYTDLGTDKILKRLPVVAQVAWFRMKYPEGKIAVQMTTIKDSYVATARIYSNYKESAEAYLAEATVLCGNFDEKPSESLVESAQAAAIGNALCYAGFGLQFQISGENINKKMPEKLKLNETQPEEKKSDGALEKSPDKDNLSEALKPTETITQTELTLEEKFKKAMLYPCPITKHAGKTLGEVLTLDPGAIRWTATKYTGDEKIKEAAKTICEFSLQQTA